MSEHANGPWPDVAVPPGEVLADLLEAREFSQADLARRMGRPPQAINEIVQGKKAISPETAFQLESVLGTPAYIWVNLERDYRFISARLEQREQLASEADVLSDFPYAEMARRGWVPKTRDPLERIRNLRSFFGVASLHMLKDVLPDAARVARTRRPDWGALAAWLRQGERMAEHVETAPYDRKQLTAALDEFRAMTRERPEGFQSRMKQLCARCGVALVFVPHLPKTYAHGATKWLTDSKALVQVSLRGCWADIFWFSFFHELGHIIKHGKTRVFIETQDAAKDAEEREREREADRFAADVLIPPDRYNQLAWQGNYSADSLRKLAVQIGVAPGVVVGRLQHEGLLPRTHLHGLRDRYVFSNGAD